MLIRRRLFVGDDEVLSARAKRHLDRHVADGERPLACLRGRFNQSLALFPDRLVVVKPGFLVGAAFGAKVTTLYLSDVSGIHTSGGIIDCCIELTSPAYPRGRRRDGDRPRHRLPNCIRVRRRRLSAYAPVLAEVRARIAEAKAAPDSTQPQAPERLLSELERLGALRLAGVLSHHEFERAKRMLLGTSEAA